MTALPSFFVPTYSPGYIGRGNRRLEGIVLRDIERAVKLRDGWRPKWDRSKYILKPSLERTLKVLRSMASRKKRVAYDIETNGEHPMLCQVRCIAFYDGDVALCVPFEYRDGSFTEYTLREATGTKKAKTKKVANWKPYWSKENLQLVKEAMQAVFDTAQLDTQNGQYDRLCMKARLGMTIPSAHVTGNFDTILGHHIVSSYMPHGLGFLGSVYTEAPYYKSTDSGSAWSASSDYDLWKYCCDDVVVTRDVATTIRAEIRERKEDIALYAHDSWQEQECQRWREVGIQVDRRAQALLQKRYGEMRDKSLAAMRTALLKQAKKTALLPDEERPELTELLERLGDLQSKEDDSDEDAKGDAKDPDGTRLFNPASLRQLRLLLAHLSVPLSEETATGEISTAKEFLLGARKQLYASKESANLSAPRRAA